MSTKLFTEKQIEILSCNQYMIYYNSYRYQWDLKKMTIDRIGVSHCTGFEMSMRLAQLFGEKYFNCNVGTVIEA